MVAAKSLPPVDGNRCVKRAIDVELPQLFTGPGVECEDRVFAIVWHVDDVPGNLDWPVEWRELCPPELGPIRSVEGDHVADLVVLVDPKTCAIAYRHRAVLQRLTPQLVSRLRIEGEVSTRAIGRKAADVDDAIRDSCSAATSLGSIGSPLELPGFTVHGDEPARRAAVIDDAIGDCGHARLAAIGHLVAPPLGAGLGVDAIEHALGRTNREQAIFDGWIKGDGRVESPDLAAGRSIDGIEGAAGVDHIDQLAGGAQSGSDRAIGGEPPGFGRRRPHSSA